MSVPVAVALLPPMAWLWLKLLLVTFAEIPYLDANGAAESRSPRSGPGLPAPLLPSLPPMAWFWSKVLPEMESGADRTGRWRLLAVSDELPGPAIAADGLIAAEVRR